MKTTRIAKRRSKFTAAERPGLLRRATQIHEGVPVTHGAIQLHRILVPIDFSACSLKALNYALPFAKQHHASITLAYVVEANRSGGEFNGPLALRQGEKQIRRAAQNRLTTVAQQVAREGVTCRTLVQTGRAFCEIVEIARTHAIDLIVISTHGERGLPDYFLNSTAECVLRYAPCPVLVVREQEHDFVASHRVGHD